MSLKILATADIHIGRRPSKIANPLDAQRFSCARMWEAIVDRAIHQHVDLVALVGDVVDHDNRFFEATGPLERGLDRLGEHGIHTYAVAGNHDYDVLPKIAEAVGSDHFHLLGRGGRWEEVVFTRRGGRRLRIHGWSFPTNHVLTSPLAQNNLAAGGDVPILGLLHADLDAPQSEFAPVTSAELQSHEVALWLLGHVHRPGYLPADAGPAVLYPGSPQAMDPGETGPHGPWLIEIHGPRNVSATPLAMSKVRYDELEVNLAGAQMEEEFEARTTASVREHLAGVAEGDGPLEELCLRLELVGRTPLCGRIAGQVRRMEEQFERSMGGVTARIDKVTNNTTPQIDLDDLAQKHDAPGVLAGMLLRLQSGEVDEDLKLLLQQAREKMLEVHRAGAYVRIDDDPAPDHEAARQHLVYQGMLLLETLRGQERTR